MAMVYQKGRVYEKGKRIKKWYGQYRLYMKDREGKEVERTRKVVIGLKSELRKYQAEEKLQAIIRGENGKTGTEVTILKADDSVTFDWFVKEKYLPIRRGRWRPATRAKTEHEIKKYLVEKFKNVPLRDVGLFELQTQLNDLASRYCESVVKHTFVNMRSIMRLAQRLKFIAENPSDETRMPATRPVARPTITPEQINSLIQAIEDPHDLCLMCIGLFCATRTSETFGLQWKSYLGDRLTIRGTAYEGKLYREQVKTGASRNAIPVPKDIIPVVEAWKKVCTDTSPDSLMFPTYGAGVNKGKQVPRRAKNFLNWRIHPIADRLKIPRTLITFQVMRRTLGTDLQEHGTMKDAQSVLRHASIKTTADVYMQQIPESVRAAINSRTRAVLAKGRDAVSEVKNTTCPNVSQLAEEVSVSD
jgi:integrase